MNQYTEPWTDAQIQRLEELVRQNLSARAISAQMGRTRNAIIGKIRRLNLELHYTTRKLTRKSLEKEELRTRKPRALSFIDPTPVFNRPLNPKREGKTIMELEPEDCRYALNRDRPYRFCAKQITNSAYCQAHYDLCHDSKKLQPLEGRYGKVS